MQADNYGATKIVGSYAKIEQDEQANGQALLQTCQNITLYQRTRGNYQP